MARSAAWPTLVAGLLVMVWTGLRAGRYQPPWLESEPLCLARGECTPADIESGLRALWWVTGAGGVLVLAGVVLTVLRLPALRTAAPAGRRPAVLHGLLAAAVGAVLSVLAAFPLLLALLAGPHAMPAALACFWLAQAGLVAWLDSSVGAPATAPRRAWLTALVASAGATVAGAGAFLVSWAGLDPWWGYAAADGVVLGAAVAVSRLVLDPRTPGRRVVLLQALAVLAVLAAAAGALVGAHALARSGPDATALPGPVPLPSTGVPSPAVPSPVPGPLPAPAPSPVPVPPPVAADVPCTPEGVDLTVVGFDAALGARAASVQARNTGDEACWVEGVPVVTLLQGGRPLSLTVEPGRSPAGGPATVQRVGIPPGGTALALLTWRTHAGWADAVTPQAVTVALDPSSPPVEVGIVGGPPGAPFDLADGGAWAIAPWAPPWS